MKERETSSGRERRVNEQEVIRLANDIGQNDIHVERALAQVAPVKGATSARCRRRTSSNYAAIEASPQALQVTPKLLFATVLEVGQIDDEVLRKYRVVEVARELT